MRNEVLLSSAPLLLLLASIASGIYLDRLHIDVLEVKTKAINKLEELVPQNEREAYISKVMIESWKEELSYWQFLRRASRTILFSGAVGLAVFSLFLNRLLFRWANQST